jgi:hypothetical protein
LRPTVPKWRPRLLRGNIDNAMVKAVARAFRWRDMLESGQYATIREIANAEKTASLMWVAYCG